MTKKSLKNLSFRLTFLGLMLFLNNCQKPEYSSGSNNSVLLKNETSLRVLTFKEFLNQKNSKIATNKIEKLETIGKNLRGSVPRIIIDTSSIKQITKNNTTSYTFKVVKDNNDLTYIENLVIQIDSLQDSKAYIIKYFIEDNNISDDNFTGRREVSMLDSDIDIASSRLGTVTCLSLTTIINHYLCDPGVPHTPETCDYQYTEEITSTVCSSLDSTENFDTFVFVSIGGGGGGTTGSDNQEDPNYDPTDPSIHGNGGNGVLEPVMTSPILHNNDSNNNHVTELEEMSNNSKIKARIVYLAGIVNSSTTEQGSQFQTDTSDPSGYSEIIIPLANLGFSGVSFPIPTINSLIRIHLHHNNLNADGDGLAPVFSAQDVIGLATFYNDKEDLSATDSESVTSFLVSRRGVYALRITDPEKAEELNDKLYTNMLYNGEVTQVKDIILLLYERDVIQKTDDYCGGCSEATEDSLFELFFIKFLINLDAGITLFEGTEGPSGDFTWQPLN